MPGRYKLTSDLPAQIPLFPLSGALLLPRTDLPLSIFEQRYLAMVEQAMAGDRIIGLIQPEEDDESDKPKLEKVGCAGRITSYMETDDGRLQIVMTGICRFKLKREVKVETPFRQAQVDYKPFAADLVIGTGAPSVNRAQLLEAFRQYLEANNMTTDWKEVNEVGTEILVNTLSLMAPYPPREKQALLEAPDLKSRAEVLVALTELALKRSLAGNTTRMQ
ncbi:LON peptidase substrate-binding domain-containing protein [Aestuariivirga litoralis]|uniref:LON peptidase substrate-binding domain-containing protein n=1 Tax=Aestuariivirga litoralis TaxID=2650924 RepID=UPI0018C531F6|nr:LON peptidase substrate-binding domain-containing protein [Aestuariivirga litoralis]MBG1233750.1 peptidase S16 [Aestuariivirga litoralis]